MVIHDEIMMMDVDVETPSFKNVSLRLSKQGAIDIDPMNTLETRRTPLERTQKRKYCSLRGQFCSQCRALSDEGNPEGCRDVP